MGALEQEFQALIDEEGLDYDAADQLEHAAGALAKMPPFMAQSITSQRRVESDQVLAFFALARRLAQRYGFCLAVDHGDVCVVKFSWPEGKGDPARVR